jgi:hypothetical protein
LSKTFKRKINKHREEEREEDYYGHVKHNINKSKKKRLDRAIKTMDIDTLMDDDLYEAEYSNEWGD